MIQYNVLSVELSNSQVNKLKLGPKNCTEVTLNLSSNEIGNSNDETNFLHKLLLTNTQISRFCKAFVNKSSDDTKLSKTQLYKIGQSGGFLNRLLGILLKTGFLLMNNLLKPLVKTVFIPLGLTAAASTTDASIRKKVFRSGMATFISSNEEMDDIMTKVKSVEEFGLLIKAVIKAIKNEVKEEKGGILGKLLGTLGANLCYYLKKQ